MFLLLRNRTLSGRVSKQVLAACRKKSFREYGGTVCAQAECTLGSKPKSLNLTRIQPMSLITKTQTNYEELSPYNLSKDDIANINQDAMEVLTENIKNSELLKITSHLFTGQENRKMCLMMLAILIGKAVNYHMNKDVTLSPIQRKVAMISDMLVASLLMHDDVIDNEVFRRGKPSVNVLWKEIKPSIAANVLLGITMMQAGKHLTNELTMTVIQMSYEVYKGQLIQYDCRASDNERFSNYMLKTRAKAGLPMSLISKAMVQAAGADYFVTEVAMKWTDYVTRTTIFLDDALDLESDLREGVATAPVLFACKKHPQLYKLIKRQFREPGDVETALELVYQSQGLKETQMLAAKYGEEAIRHAQSLTDSPYRRALETLSTYFVDRIEVGDDNKIVDLEKKRLENGDFY